MQLTIEAVCERLDELLGTSKAKVLLLTGGWGAGKTYQWKHALQRAAVNGNRPKYAYVSLFGLTSLGEVRKRIVEEMVSGVDLPGNAGTLGEEIENGGWRLKPFQIIKLLPVFPYISKLEGLANELSFGFVRNAVICFDDLERGGTALRLADVFGLASFLKEERNCRVVLISNQEKFMPDNKRDFDLYLEKVVDENVDFAPTPTEACNIALGEKPDTARTILREKIVALRISNIRVIWRLSDLSAELATTLDGLHESVLNGAIQTLALFGASHLLPTDGFPPTDYLLKLSGGWGGYLGNTKKAGEQTDEERKQAAWADLLDRYGYVETDELDVEIARGVSRGYFDKTVLLPIATSQSANIEATVKQKKYHEAWTRFWHSLDGDSRKLLEALHIETLSAISVIGPGDLQPAYEVYRQAGMPEVANELLESFIACNQHRPAIFEQVDGAFSEMYSEPFASVLREEAAKHAPKPSIEEAIDRIDFERGWNSEDIEIVAKSSATEIENLLRNVEGRRFRVRIKTLLRLGSLEAAKDDEKRVSAETIQLLRRLATEDPVIAIRMRQYLPPDPPADSADGSS